MYIRRSPRSVAIFTKFYRRKSQYSYTYIDFSLHIHYYITCVDEYEIEEPPNGIKDIRVQKITNAKRTTSSTHIGQTGDNKLCLHRSHPPEIPFHLIQS